MCEEKEVILTIRNHHIEDCGSPPKLDLGAGKWICYFENVHGEQFVMQFDRMSDLRSLRRTYPRPNSVRQRSTAYCFWWPLCRQSSSQSLAYGVSQMPAKPCQTATTGLLTDSGAVRRGEHVANSRAR